MTRTQDGAPFTIGGVYDERTGEVKWGIEVPKLLSLLAHHDPNARVVGLDAVSPEDRPPVNVVRFAFQTMIGIGTGLALLGTVFFVTWLRRRWLPRSPWFYRAVMAAGPLSFVALISGWITTEVGRQPWVVYGLARVSASLAVVAVVVGWALAQDPYVLPPELTLDEAAAGDATLSAVVISMAVGMLILAPSLWLLYRLVPQGRLDQAYEPLDQRFRPLTASDEPPSPE